MPETVLPSEEARRRLPELLRLLSKARGGRSPRYVIGRHRRPEAVLLGVHDFEQLSKRAGEESPVRDPATLLGVERGEILRIAKQHGASDVRVFGSVARGEVAPESDVDFLVRLEPGRTLLDLGGLLSDLEALLGRRVDVVSEGGLREGFRQRVLREAVPL